MKLLFDFLPIILFFGTFKFAEGRKDWAAQFASDHLGFIVSGGVVGPNEAPVLLATVVVMLTTLTQVLYLLARGRKVDMVLWVSLGLITVFGGATVWFHSETFIKWKFSVFYWFLGLAFWISQAIFGKNLPQALMGKELKLPGPVWQRLNFTWVAFFGFMGLLNLYVFSSFSTETWVSFKTFGVIGLTLVFMVGQGFYISRHMRPETEEPASSAHPGSAP